MATSHTAEQPVEEGAWWRSPGEAYWRAVLEQGEVVPEPVPPAEPQESVVPVQEAEDMSPADPHVENAYEPDSGGRWQAARHALDCGDTFCLQVVGANRGGLVVDWRGLQGFVPASHLRVTPHTRDPQERISELARRVGEVLTVRVIEVDEGQSRLVLSEKGIAPDGGLPVIRLSEVHPGDMCRGTVVNLTSFGAFVDLGGVEGLLHISEMSWDRLSHPSDMLHPGDVVDVHVLGVNPEEGRIALSLKRLRPNPWSQVDSRYQVGQLVEGTITNVVSFGAFVRLDEGLEGLIHVSELAEGSLMHPRNVVREGDAVLVRVLSIDTSKRRLGLSLRQAHGDAPAAW